MDADTCSYTLQGSTRSDGRAPCCVSSGRTPSAANSCPEVTQGAELAGVVAVGDMAHLAPSRILSLGEFVFLVGCLLLA